MRSVWIFVVTVLLHAGVGVAGAELAVPALSGRVVDQASLFSAADEQRLTAALQGLESAPQGAQMAVLTVPSLDGDALELFSIRVVEAWKLGRKDVDNGLLLLISRDDHKIRFEVGYGLEGRLTDARCGDIIRGMGDYFRGQRFADGVLFAIGHVQAHLTGALPAGMPEQTAQSASKRGKPDFIFLLMVLIFFVLPAITRARYGWGHTIFLSGGRGGGFSGGGFSGGGGSFGGGGASGSW